MTTKVGPDTIIPERAPAFWVPMRFFLTGLAFLAGLLGIAYWKSGLLAADYLHNPATLAVTHLFTLGLGGTVVTGALYQMLPVLLYSTLFSERMADVHLAIHAVGVLFMVYGFLEFATTWVALGGSLVVTGALLFLVNAGMTLRRAERWNWHGVHMAAAILFYLTTLTWGLGLAFNQKYGFLGEVEGAPLTGHLTLGLLGWFSLMIISAGLKLLPMFAPAKVLPAPLVAATGAGLTAGVLLILAGLWLGRFLVWMGGILAAAALVAYLVQIGYAYLRRRKGPLRSRQIKTRQPADPQIDRSTRFSVGPGYWRGTICGISAVPEARRGGVIISGRRI
jgi:hypothetical protein